LAPEANAWPNNTVGNNRVTLSHTYLFFTFLMHRVL